MIWFDTPWPGVTAAQAGHVLPELDHYYFIYNGRAIAIDPFYHEVAK